MRQLFIIAILAIASLQISAQSLRGSYNAANYYAYDTTTFYLGAAKDVKWVYVDFTTLDADDAVLKIGGGGSDAKSQGFLKWLNNSTTETDSLIMDVSANSHTLRNSSGTRYTTSRAHFWFKYGIPSNFVTITVYWNSVTSGRLDIYY